MWNAYRNRYCGYPADPAHRRHVRRLVVTAGIYMALFVGVQKLLPLDRMEGPALWFFAALPGLPIAAVFVLFTRYLVEMTDEYRRMLEVRKALIATGITLTIATIWGFLEMLADASRLPTFYIPIIWFGSLGIGGFVNTLLERRAGAEN